VEGEVEQGGRDGLAPRLPDLRLDPEPYDADAFEWSVVSAPPGSDGDVLSFATPTTPVPRYDAGNDHVAEFEADAPGRYRLRLDAPDGIHELTVHAFPGSEDAPRPRLELDAGFDASTERFRIESNAALAPSSEARDEDLRVEFLADDRDPLRGDEIEGSDDGLSATVPLDALGEEVCRVHAAAYDGRRASVGDSIELHPDGGVTLPNRPPEWLDDAVLYQIFPRSWAGERGATTFETLIDGDPETGARGVDYLADLGVDVLWLTPVVPAASAEAERAGGGPHGYDTLDYFDVAPDLTPDGTDPLDAYAAFVDACHDRGIRVCFDLVVSHAGFGIDEFVGTIGESAGSESLDGEDPLRVLAWDEGARTFDWWDRAALRRYAPDGTVLEERPRPTGFADLRSMPNWNYEHVAAREFLLCVVDFWSRVVGVDGFRCDVAFGVQHSFWREVREVVRANDAEFFTLDETIPNDPAFSENQFDAHFDTTGLTYTAQDLVRRLSPRREPAASGIDAREPDPTALIEAVCDRRDRGHPDHALFLNSVENHDEHRLLNLAAVDPLDPDHDDVTDEEWNRAARLQRACFAACVTLPGIPTVYYGAERAISRYGTGRWAGEGDGRGTTPGGSVDPDADVRPGGRQRAFTNWERYDAAHLAFYRRLIDRYHDLDALHADAALRTLSVGGDHEVAFFVREANASTDVSGPESVLVALNFEADPVPVDLPPGVEPSDLLGGSGGDGTTVTLDVVGVFALDGPIGGTPVVGGTTE
jgi:glycosidase